MMLGRLRPRARVEDRESAEGDEAYGDGREQEGGEALGDAAHGHAPLGVDEVLQGHEEERSEAECEDENEPEHPVGPEAFRTGCEVGAQNAQAAEGDGAPEQGGGMLVLAHGTTTFRSSSLAFWARWRART